MEPLCSPTERLRGVVEGAVQHLFRVYALSAAA